MKEKKLLILILIFIVNSNLFSQTVIKMKRDGGISIIPCKVNGLNLNFIFDTGASSVSLSMTEATFMLKNGYLSESDILGTNKIEDATGKISEGVIINLKEIEIAGFHIIGGLLQAFISALMQPQTMKSKNLLHLIPKQFVIDTHPSKTYASIQSIVDYIAGMTDLYALDLYRKITGINVPELN